MKKCCIIGHRKIEVNNDLLQNLRSIIVDLIENKKVNIFMFGSKSMFSSVCYNIVTDLKYTYKNIKRIYVRAEYPNISDEYEKYLHNFYEDTWFFDDNCNAGKLNYIKRNEAMIDCCDLCLFFYNKEYIPPSNTRSGTALAYKYAVEKKKIVINLHQCKRTPV